jgi:site-specific recombinase XerD
MVELRRVVRSTSPPEMPIFTRPRGGELHRGDFYRMVWQPALRAAGLDDGRYKFHAARHFAVSNMLGRGVSLVEVAAYVGDAPETIMGVYAHFLRESEPHAMRALDLALAPMQLAAGCDTDATREGPSTT